MNKLKQYLLGMRISERVDFASRCGTSWPFLRNVAYGYRPAGGKLSVQIEIESRGQVTRKDLRPDDWQDIWPELIDPHLDFNR